MKTVKEIKEMASEWNKGDISSNEAFLTVLDVLIGITEHLEAQQLAIPRAFGPLINPDDERRGMIAALRWADRVTQSGGVEYSAIGKAIARLENGGDL